MATMKVDIGMGGASNVPTSSQQYGGFARLYNDPRYRPMTTPQELLIEQARLREEEIMRQWREAQAAQSRAVAAGQPTTFASGVASAASGFVSGVTGFGSMLEEALGSAVEWAAPKPGEGLIDPAESAAKYGPSQDQLLADLISNDPELQQRFGPSDIQPTRGPERDGQHQIPVYQTNGQLRGYKYVDNAVSSEKAIASPTGAAIDTAAGPIGPDDAAPMTSPDMAGSSAALSSYEPGAYDRKGNFNTAWNQGTNAAEARKFDARYQAVQAQAYGAPTGFDRNGLPEYDSSYQRYIGIEGAAQKAGIIPTRLPNPLGPNSTPEQRAEFEKRSAEAYIAPRYVVGQNYYDVQRMDKAGKIALQKQLRSTGLYDANTPIIPGVFSADDYGVLEKVYAFSNQTGLSKNQVVIELKRASDAAKARAASSGGGGSGPDNRSVSIQYTQTSLAAGRALLARTLADALGRAPSDSELADYMSMLNAAEKKSPTKTVTNYVRGGGSTTATSRTTPSTVDPEAMAREFATRINGGDDLMTNKANSYMDMLVNRLTGAANV